MKYKVITADEVAIIEEKVNDSIERGWEPLGGIVVDNEINGDLSEVYTTGQYLQTMVKK